MIKARMDGDRLTDEQIVNIIAISEHSRWLDNERFYRGKNPGILRQLPKTKGVPDNRLPFSYGRKLTKTVLGYMFSRPSHYTALDNERLKRLTDILSYNSGDAKTYKTARNIVVHGVAYELVYQGSVDGKPFPAFVPISPANGIPVYNYDIEPKMIAFIYLRRQTTETLMDVWYQSFVDKCVLELSNTITHRELIPHICGIVPVAVFQADDDNPQAIFESVKPQIEAVDKISSSDMNEIEKFALALRVLTGGGDISEDNVRQGDEGKTLVLDEGQKLEYLTRTVDMSFHGNVRDYLISEIHKQSGIPDFADPKFTALSGLALEYKLMDFENVCATYESGMRTGLLQRASLIETIVDYAKPVSSKIYEWVKGIFIKKDDFGLWVDFPRNRPQDDQYKLDCAAKMRNVGVSLETTLKYLPMIDDVDKELELIQKENENVYSLGPDEQDFQQADTQTGNVGSSEE